METARAAEAAGLDATIVWHRDRDIAGADIVLLPGGFSYGDYLRSGAIARFSPILHAVREHARRGGAVLGICNGFQILCEAGLLPGALNRNAGLAFVSRPVGIRVERVTTPFTTVFGPGTTLRLPVAHGEGRFVAPADDITRLEAEGRVVLRYVEGQNPNGSVHDIAGIANAKGNVVGIMPHPERAVGAVGAGADGAGFFASMASWVPIVKGVV